MSLRRLPLPTRRVAHTNKCVLESIAQKRTSSQIGRRHAVTLLISRCDTHDVGGVRVRVRFVSVAKMLLHALYTYKKLQLPLC